ncbi:hypothetical protein F2Q69_00047339 [Brassica cretica]|uniref:Uncharacterized protein n=1 Tax=Brassica cretica TaxID=69181 RepID=A0A8S9PEQ4_BRACR|nr:hypothetical protein F2Q69_00047339 [Brassica cretica]
MRNFSTCKDVMKQINKEHKLLGKDTLEPSNRQSQSSVDRQQPSIIDRHPSKTKIHYGCSKAIDGRALQVSREDILQMANRADNLFMQQHTVPTTQQRVTTELYDAAGDIDIHFKQKNRHHTRPSIDVDVHPSIDRRPKFGSRAFYLFGTRKFYWEAKDEYGLYSDDQGCARGVDGHVINVSKDDIRKLMERASREINEMFYGVCGAQEKYEGDFQMKLDGVYYPLNDSISWLTTCMEEIRQDIAKI